MPRKVVTKEVFIVNNSGRVDWPVHGTKAKIPLGRTPVNNLRVPSGAHADLTKQKLAEFVCRKSITSPPNGGPAAQLIRLEYVTHVGEVPFSKEDMTPEEIQELKLELRDEMTEELTDHLKALEAKKKQLLAEIDNLTPKDNGLPTN